VSDVISALMYACLFFAAEPPRPDVHVTPDGVALHGEPLLSLHHGTLAADQQVGQLVPDLYDPLIAASPDDAMRVVVEPGVDVDTAMAVVFTVRQAGADQITVSFADAR